MWTETSRFHCVDEEGNTVVVVALERPGPKLLKTGKAEFETLFRLQGSGKVVVRDKDDPSVFRSIRKGPIYRIR
jgi:hypothetical protein